MRFDWLANSYHELAHLAPDEQKEVVQSAASRALRSRSYWLKFHIPCLLFLILVFFAGIFLVPNIPWSSPWRLPLRIATFALLLAGPLSIAVYGHRLRKAYVGAELLERGLRPSRCLVCGYDLWASTGDRCPECGTRLAAAEEPDAT